MENKTLKNAIQITVSLLIGGGLFWWVYKDQDIDRMVKDFEGAKIFWILFPLALGLLSHFVRALRWKMLIEPLGKSPKTSNVFCSVLVAYFANFILPRAGEVARCGVLKKYEGISFTGLLGTVIVERTFDMIVLLCIVAVTFAAQFDVIYSYLHSEGIIDSLAGLASHPVFIGLTALTIALLFFFRKKIMSLSIFDKVRGMINNMISGLKSFTKMKNKWLFIFHSVMIFALYYGMLYFSFWAFDFTENLSILAGLVTYVIGSFGIVAPVQGGIGAWHYLTIGALGLYGVAHEQAATFAFVVHLAQMLMLIGAGAISLVVLQVINRKK